MKQLTEKKIVKEQCRFWKSKKNFGKAEEDSKSFEKKIMRNNRKKVETKTKCQKKERIFPEEFKKRRLVEETNKRIVEKVKRIKKNLSSKTSDAKKN